MMDPEDLERLVLKDVGDMDLVLAYLGLDLRKLYNEGVQLRIDGKPEPGENSGSDRVRSLGWNHEAERGCGGEP